jgi:Zn-dependent protease
VFGSYRLFTVLGIPVRVHGSLILFLLLAGLLFSGGEGLTGFLVTVLLLALVFGFVLLHELGHSVVALYHGVPVRQITLYPLGGIASLSEMPREPRVELQVAVAGPLVNFVLGGAFFAFALVAPPSWFTFLLQLVIFNVFLGLFNLLPGFPMDGGRILRAFLATRLPYARATRIAARVGQGTAVLLGIAGLLLLRPMLVLVAMFVFFAAQAELVAATLRSPGSALNEFMRRVRSLEQRTRPSNGGTRPSGSGWFTPGAGAGDQAAPPDDEGECVIEIGPDGKVRKITRRAHSSPFGDSGGRGPSGFF